MPMTWDALLSRDRLGRPAGIVSERARSEFESDVDRIIFSGSFRRLSRKTQVHPLASNDHVHTRLTHSLEVARVGAALGKQLGMLIHDELPEWCDARDLSMIVHAACLAHDIGNPPFGHAGESAIKGWFRSGEASLFSTSSLDEKHRRDLLHYEGNAQGLRVLTQIENHVFSGGLQLTFAVLGSFMKYPWTSEYNPRKFGAYLSELPILQKIAQETGLVKLGENRWCRHPLAMLVEAADDICYGIVDLEDAVELNLLTFEQVFTTLTKTLTEHERSEIRASFGHSAAHRVNLSRLRSMLFDELVSAAVDAFLASKHSIMNGDFSGDLFDSLPAANKYKTIVASAKELAANEVYGSARKLTLELGCASTYDCLLRTFCDAAVRASSFLIDESRSALDWKSKLVLQLLGDHSPLVSPPPPNERWSEYQCLRRVLDFVGGMTDNYAVHIATQLQGG